MFNKHPNYLYRALVILFCLFAIEDLAPVAHAQLGLGLVPMRVELRMAPARSIPIP
jgi:hypothetical protein